MVVNDYHNSPLNVFYKHEAHVNKSGHVHRQSVPMVGALINMSS